MDDVMVQLGSGEDGECGSAVRGAGGMCGMRMPDSGAD